ncbi:MAG: hypothetical protein QMD08_03930 [Actinomycetota bacterium]|nr:hypothetical protein [Actinomycetota bacterium]
MKEKWMREKWLCPSCSRAMESDCFGLCRCPFCDSQYQFVLFLGSARLYPLSSKGAVDFRYPYPAEAER